MKRVFVSLLMMLIVSGAPSWGQSINLNIRFTDGSSEMFKVDEIRKMDFNDTLFIFFEGDSSRFFEVSEIADLVYTNTPPQVPSNPFPADQAELDGSDPVLSWVSEDEEGDPLYYSLFFSQEEDPALAADSLRTSAYKTSNLCYNTRYYWKVVVTDLFNTVAGPVWSFVNGYPKVSFTRYPAVKALGETEAVLGWSLDFPAVCSLSYSAAEGDPVKIAAVTTDSLEYKAVMGGLVSASEYEYSIAFYYQDSVLLNTSKTFNFKTLAEQIEKKIQLEGKPAVLSRSDQSVTISFQTDQSVYGICRLYQDDGETAFADTAACTEHRAVFAGLSPLTRYHYQVGVKDSLTGEEYYLETEYLAVTLEAADQSPPVILSGPEVVPDSTFALITLKTNEGCYGELYLNQASRPEIKDTFKIETPAREHQYFITRLSPGADYEFSLRLTDPSGNVKEWNGEEESALARFSQSLPKEYQCYSLSEGESGSGGFSTTTQSDTSAPLFIKKPQVLMAYDSLAILRWKTDEPSRARIKVMKSGGELIYYKEFQEYYSRQIAYLLRLEPGTRYDVELTVLDINENESVQETLQFITRQDSRPIEAKIIRPAQTFASGDFTLLVWGTDIPGDSRGRSALDQAMANGTQVYFEEEMTTDHLLVLGNLELSTTYYYQLESYDFREEPVYVSEEVQSFTTAESNDETVHLAYAVQPAVVYRSADLVKITWETNVLSQFVLEYSSPETGEVLAVSGQDMSKEHSLLLTSLAGGTEYHLDLTARTISGEEAAFSLDFETREEGYEDAEAPETLTGLEVENDTLKGGTVLQWEACSAPDLAGYRVYRRDINSGDTLLIANNLEERQYVDDYFQEGENRHVYGVTAFDYAGNESLPLWSEEIVDVNEKNVFQGKKLHLAQNYPNPFNPRTVIEFASPKSGTLKLNIYDITGKKVWTKEYRQPGKSLLRQELDCRSWGSGIYIYQLTAPNGENIRKKMILIK